MANLLGSLLTQFSGQDIEKMSNQLGLSKDDTKSALGTAVPILLNALAKNAQSPEEAQALDNAIARDHDGGILDNLGDFLSNPNLNDGEGILKHVLGQRKDTVANYIGKDAGIDQSSASNLLKMVAPIVLGFLGKKKNEPNSSNFVGDILGSFLNSDEAPDSKTQNIFEQLLDQDNDGNIMDDIADLGKSYLGKLFK